MRTTLLAKLSSRKLWLAVSTAAALIANRQYDKAAYVAIAYILAEAHIDAQGIVQFAEHEYEYTDASEPKVVGFAPSDHDEAVDPEPPVVGFAAPSRRS